MKITGKIIKALPVQSGVSKSGNTWTKQEYILETADQYARLICFGVMGENIAKLNIQPGQVLDVSVDIASREFGGRWYTSVMAWKVSPHQETQSAEPQPAVANVRVSDDDGLPF